MDMDGNDDMILTRLRLDINETKLQEIFGAYGTVVSCKVLNLRIAGMVVECSGKAEVFRSLCQLPGLAGRRQARQSCLGALWVRR